MNVDDEIEEIEFEAYFERVLMEKYGKVIDYFVAGVKHE